MQSRNARAGGRQRINQRRILASISMHTHAHPSLLACRQTKPIESVSSRCLFAHFASPVRCFGEWKTPGFFRSSFPDG